MDSYVHNFVNYLLYFGLIHPNLISSFENQYNILVTGLNNNNNIRFKNENKFIIKSKSVSNIKLINNKDEMIFQALNNYIMGLTSNQIKIISKNILGKFNQYIGNIRNKFLNNLVNIYSKQKLNQYIEKWKKIDFVKIENTNLNNNNIIEKKKDIKTNDNTYFKKISNEIRNKISNFKRDYSNPKKINKSYNISHNIDKKIKENKTNNFIVRQIEYSKILKLKKELIHNQNEEEIINLCSFSPKLNTITPSIKSKYKKIIQNKPSQERKRQISSSKKNNNNISSKVSERLYNDYSKYKKKKNELIKEIDIERGITFKPKSYTNKSKYYKVEGNFDDRNKKLLEDRQNFAFVYDYLRQKEIDDNLVSGGKGFNLINNYIMDSKIKNKNIKYEKLLSDSKKNENINC